ncbi:hypothetical protein T07_7618 [Trichinella nelsoni]|uniref:Uncharacterized protein n=1 Tax=Trichinella nelsoni TaxID=6336 RepID=A0A0V0SJI4_9BILA|nr:hypothetical protein T07_7618 [Trichinella nelsoni]
MESFRLLCGPWPSVRTFPTSGVFFDKPTNKVEFAAALLPEGYDRQSNGSMLGFVPSRATLQSSRLNFFGRCRLHAFSDLLFKGHQLERAPMMIAPTVQVWTPKSALTSSVNIVYLLTFLSCFSSMVVPFSQGTATSTICAAPSLTNTKSGLYTLPPDLIAVSTCTAKSSHFARSPT